jgi:tol-pal system protein YbgF
LFFSGSDFLNPVGVMNSRNFRYGLAMLLVSGVVDARTLIFDSSSDSAQRSAPVQEPAREQAETYGLQESQPIVASGLPVAPATPAMSANSELYFMLEQLQTEVSSLRGLVEEQAFQIQQMKESDKSRYQDLDDRLLELNRRIDAGGASGASSSAPAYVAPSVVPVSDAGAVAPAVSVSAEPTEEQKREYQKAYALIAEKKFDEAIDRFHAYIEKYPEGELTGNAYYWLGEVYLVYPKLEQAKQAFMIVVRSFKGHRKESDALFKLGAVFDQLQDAASSETYLNEVQARFPDSTAAKLAKSYKMNR